MLKQKTSCMARSLQLLPKAVVIALLAAVAMASTSPSFPPERLAAAATPVLKAAVHEKLRHGLQVAAMAGAQDGLGSFLAHAMAWGEFSRKVCDSKKQLHVNPPPPPPRSHSPGSAEVGRTRRLDIGPVPALAERGQGTTSGRHIGTRTLWFKRITGLELPHPRFHGAMHQDRKELEQLHHEWFPAWGLGV